VLVDGCEVMTVVGFTVTVFGALIALQPLAFVTVTV
jgi:hypothetical protein